MISMSIEITDNTLKEKDYQNYLVLNSFFNESITSASRLYKSWTVLYIQKLFSIKHPEIIRQLFTVWDSCED